MSKRLRVRVLHGKTEVLEQASLLEDLAERCGQAGAMHWLEHFLTVPTFRGRTPYLLLGVDAEAGEVLDTTNVRWAVLMYEFSLLGFGLSVFATDDISGFRTVIAPAGERHDAVTAAVNALLKQRGAQIVMVSFTETDGEEGYSLRTNIACRWAVRERAVANTLRMNEGYEATLMSLGKATRFNMRYYRRRLARRTACELVSDARAMFSEEQIDRMNAESLNPFTKELARLQFESTARLRGGFLLLLRATSGEWLGVIGGWRQAGTTVLLWQMNRAGFEKDSLGTVVRAYFVEHEVERGAEAIMFYGGTPNSIQNSFVQSKVEDVVVVRNSLHAQLLCRVAAVFAKPHWWMKSTNFVARAVSSDAMMWRENEVRAEQLK